MTQAPFFFLHWVRSCSMQIPFSTLHSVLIICSLFLSFSSQCQGCRQRHRLSRPTPLDLVRFLGHNDHFNHYCSSDANNRPRRRHTQGDQDNCAGGTQQRQVNGSPAAALRGLASTTLHVSRVMVGRGNGALYFTSIQIE